MPKISIIVPVYKVEKYIRKCLDSVLAQTFSDWECIIVNDGSPDNSLAICEEYAKKDARFKVYSQENRGLSGARNTGMSKAKGDYIGFLDSDDYIEQKMYEVLYSKTQDYLDLEAVGCVRQRISFEGIKSEVVSDVADCDRLFTAKEFSRMKYIPDVHIHCTLIKREFLENHKIVFKPELIAYEDGYFWYECVWNMLYGYYHINEVLTYWVINHESITSKKGLYINKLCFALRELWAYDLDIKARRGFHLGIAADQYRHMFISSEPPVITERLLIYINKYFLGRYKKHPSFFSKNGEFNYSRCLVWLIRRDCFPLFFYSGYPLYKKFKVLFIIGIFGNWVGFIKLIKRVLRK